VAEDAHSLITRHYNSTPKAGPHAARLTSGASKGIDWRVNIRHLIWISAALFAGWGITCGQEPPPPPAAESESEVIAEPIPPTAIASAVEAVAKLGEEVVLGRYHVAIERMNPVWKERTAARMGGMEMLEKQLAGVAAQMVQQGISMISFKPQGQPKAYEVAPGRKLVRENGREVERMVFTKWLVLVPTVTRFRIMQEGNPRPLVIESTGYQVAISDKDRNHWTFIDGAGLKPGDLRGIFITLPQNMELPPVGKREIR
jgi:hypothetical protein